MKLDKFEKTKFQYGEIVLEANSGKDYHIFDVKESRIDDIYVCVSDGNRVKEIRESNLIRFNGDIVATVMLSGDIFSAFHVPFPVERVTEADLNGKCKWKYIHIGAQESLNEFLDNFEGDYPFKVIGIVKKIKDENT